MITAPPPALRRTLIVCVIILIASGATWGIVAHLRQERHTRLAALRVAEQQLDARLETARADVIRRATLDNQLNVIIDAHAGLPAWKDEWEDFASAFAADARLSDLKAHIRPFSADGDKNKDEGEGEDNITAENLPVMNVQRLRMDASLLLEAVLLDLAAPLARAHLRPLGCALRRQYDEYMPLALSCDLERLTLHVDDNAPR
jgi:hypothetical protein